MNEKKISETNIKVENDKEGKEEIKPKKKRKLTQIQKDIKKLYYLSNLKIKKNITAIKSNMRNIL